VLELQVPALQTGSFTSRLACVETPIDDLLVGLVTSAQAVRADAAIVSSARASVRVDMRSSPVE
jgi:hypothetical protein